jgi:hypothetical protein
MLLSNPFALSLSKGCPSSVTAPKSKVQGFDKLSPSGGF